MMIINASKILFAASVALFAALATAGTDDSAQPGPASYVVDLKVYETAGSAAARDHDETVIEGERALTDLLRDSHASMKWQASAPVAGNRSQVLKHTQSTEYLKSVSRNESSGKVDKVKDDVETGIAASVAAMSNAAGQTCVSLDLELSELVSLRWSESGDLGVQLPEVARTGSSSRTCVSQTQTVVHRFHVAGHHLLVAVAARAL